MERKVGWGVLGTANIGVRETFAAMRQAGNCRMVAIAGRSAEKARAFQERFGFERAYASYDELLEDPQVEAVYIALPNSLHKQWVLRAADAGKHVLCEKPLGTTEQEAREMFARCQERGVRLMEAFAYLHSPVIAEAVRCVEAGEIGALRMVQAAFFTRGYYDKPENIRARRETFGGSVYDLGVYNISLAHRFFGRAPEAAQAVAHFTPLGVDDFCAELLDFGEGRLGVLENGMCTHCARLSYFRIFGTEGMIDAPVGFNQQGAQTFSVQRPGRQDEAVTVDCPNNYRLEIEQFGRVVRGLEEPLVGEAFSLGVARTVDQVLRQIGY